MQSFDPVTEDERNIDALHPPGMAAFVIPSHGVHMNAICYIANGRGPHPAVVLLHGYPGNERNLDLAQVLRRAGYCVLVFHYRGAWGSGGSFGYAEALADAHVAVDYLMRSENAARLRVDPARVALVGHSFGASLALQTGAGRDDVRGVVALATYRMAEVGRAANRDPRHAEALVTDLDESRVLRGFTGQTAVGLLQLDPEAYDLIDLAPRLRNAPVLLVGALRDTACPLATHQRPIAAALAEAGVDVTAVELDTDHAFSGKRITLARLVVDWLQALPDA